MASKIDTRKNNPEHLRSMLDGSALIEKVLTLTAYLEQGWMPEYDYPRDIPVTEVRPHHFKIKDWIVLNNAQLQRLRNTLDVYLRLLSKVLPDLKALDLHDTTMRGQLAESLSSTEKANRVAAILSSSPQGRTLLAAISQASTLNTSSQVPGPNTLQ